MNWYVILIIVVSSLLVLALSFLLGVSFVVTLMVIRPKRYSREEQDKYNHDVGYDKGTEVLKREPIEFKMKDGYVIHGDYNLVTGSNKYCILAHGHGTSREGAIRYSLVFEELGFSTIVYDQRSHGDNGRGTVTMGYRESQDLAEIIDQVYGKFGKGIVLGLQGVSMGASTVLLSTKYQQKVRFIVSDCAYATLKNVINGLFEYHHVKGKPFLPFIDMWMKLLFHCSFKKAEPISAVRTNHIPTIFFHGDKDNFVLPENQKMLYEAAISEKAMVTFPGAPHASSINVDRDLYKNSIKDFLKGIGID